MGFGGKTEIMGWCCDCLRVHRWFEDVEAEVASMNHDRICEQVDSMIRDEV